ncbi:MAG: peptide deformylase [Patescibacteria group bacterium]
MPRLLQIIKHPNPQLRKISVEIKDGEIKSDKFQSLILDMIKTMKAKDGIGLSAPQIGYNIRLITINTQNGVLIMTNPKITRNSWKKEWFEEGCLSVPGIYGKVKRHKKLNCIYIDKKGQKKKISAKGLLAFVIQHETDHLDGILFIDKAKEISEHSI